MNFPGITRRCAPKHLSSLSAPRRRYFCNRLNRAEGDLLLPGKEQQIPASAKQTFSSRWSIAALAGMTVSEKFGVLCGLQTSTTSQPQQRDRVLRRTGRSRHLHTRRFISNHLGREAFHLFVLRAELQEQEIDSSVLEFRNAFAYLLRSPYQT